MKRSDVESGIKDGFMDALKVRFGLIAGNEITQGRNYEKGAFRDTLQNLKDAYDDAMTAAADIFPDSSP